jgi:hypothetical protein
MLRIGLITAVAGVLAGALAGIYCWSISHSYIDLFFALLFASPLGALPGLIFAGLFDNPTGIHIRRFKKNFIQFYLKNNKY